MRIRGKVRGAVPTTTDLCAAISLQRRFKQFRSSCSLLAHHHTYKHDRGQLRRPRSSYDTVERCGQIRIQLAYVSADHYCIAHQQSEPHAMRCAVMIVWLSGCFVRPNFQFTIQPGLRRQCRATVRRLCCAMSETP